MPHTNRKKKSATGVSPKHIVHTKRKEVLDEEGWTHVVDKPNTTPKTTAVPSAKDEAKELWAIAADFKIGNAYYVDRTLEEVEVEYGRARKAWGKSEACRQLRVLLESKTGEERKVDKIVVLGLGSLQNARSEGRKAAATQLIALEDLIEGLDLENKVETILQDPAFTPLDTEFLSKLEYKVVPDPEAFSHITENTLVYAIHCYADIYEKVAKQGGAKILVCTDVEKFGGPSSDISESTIKTLEVMVDGYEKIPFPQIRSDFSDTRIYWKRSEETPPAMEDRNPEVEFAIPEVDTENKVSAAEETTPEKSIADSTEKMEQVTLAPESETPKDIEGGVKL